MAQTSINIRLDEDLKKEFSSLCENLGLNISTAINIFIKKSVNEWGIPFDLKAEKPSKERFFKALENVPECDDEENQELLEALNSLTEEDKKVASSKVVKW